MTAISTRKRIWGWFFFDWASQPYNTLLITFIFAPYVIGAAGLWFAAPGDFNLVLTLFLFAIGISSLFFRERSTVLELTGMALVAAGIVVLLVFG